jgi:hypothetical protein
VLAQLVHAGLMDVQDRALYNRSYTTGHKAFRARATVDLGNFLGWDDAHNVVYAGALDMAVGPRWYSTYEMACNAVQIFLEKATISAIPYAGATNAELAILANNKASLSADEQKAFETAVIRDAEPAYVEALSQLLEAGKSPRRILDALQIASAQVILETRGVNNFSLPQHCFEYLNTMAWYFDNFQHKQQLKLLYTATAYLNRAAWHQKGIGDAEPNAPKAPAGASKLSGAEILNRLDQAMVALDGRASVDWAKAYLDNNKDRGPLVQRLALMAARMGNDPHNQEIGQVTLEDWAKNQGHDRDRILLASAHHTAVHRKYGNPLDCANRFGAAMGIARLQ